MSSEVARFELARSLRRACGDIDPPGLRCEAWLADSELFTALINSDPESRQQVAQEYRGWLTDSIASIRDLGLPHGERIACLDEWLTCRQNRPCVDELEEAILRCVDREIAAGSTDGAFVPEDPLYADARRLAELLVLISLLGAPAAIQRVVIRAILVLALVERFIFANPSVSSAEKVSMLLRRRSVVLPKPIFPLPHRAKLVRRPGFADLYVIRQEWNRYVAGEIAHIENVLPHELKRRVLTRTDETETTQTTETDTLTIDERDSQSTARFELNDSNNIDTSMLVHVEAQVDTAGQYGPTHVDTHLGGSLDFSLEQAEEHSATISNEIVNRVVRRVEQRVREERTTRTLHRVVEKNVHQLDNADDRAIVGMYRWVDKIVRLQRFRYPNRYLLEFQVPEPAAYLRWRTGRQGTAGFSAPLPAPFTPSGNPTATNEPPLLPTDISEDPKAPTYYLTLMGRWHAVGVKPPPPPTLTVAGSLHLTSADPGQDKTSHDVYISPREGSAAGAGSAGSPEGQSLVIPDGYVAQDHWHGWLSTWDQDDTIPPAFNRELAGGAKGAPDTYAYVPPAMYVTVGDSQNDPNATGPHRNLVTDQRSANSLPIGGELKGRRTGVLPITVLSQNFGFFSIQARVSCDRQASTLLAWQLDTYEKLRAAYFEMLRNHEAEASARNVQAGVEIQGRSPLENSRQVREELKRQTIELLLGSRFAGTSALDIDADGRPHTNLNAAQSSAALIQFLEQAFEWENLTYVLYPYFWADTKRWDETADLQSPDPDFAAFLRCGSARVVVSVRPGYPTAVDYFLCTGFPWSGGQAPGPDDPDYVSVADEIADQTGAPDDGVPTGHSWEVRLPTTLVWLDPDPQLPKTNSEAKLPDPPDARV